MSLADRCAASVPALCARYGLPAPVHVARLEGGSANLNFVARFAERPADGPGPIKLTFCLYKDLAGVRRLVEVLTALADAPVPALRRTPEGRALVEAIRPVIVTAFAEGRPLDAIDPPTAEGIGRLLAAVHRPPPPAAPARHDMHRERVLALGAQGGALGAFLADAMARVPADDGLPTALIHGDLFPDNVIRGPDGRLWAIDFEEACRGPRVFDLGMAIVGFSLFGEPDPRDVRALVAGYTAAAPLSPAEAAALPAMVEHAAAAIAAWRAIGTPDELDVGGRDWREMRAVVDVNRRWLDDGTWSDVCGAIRDGT